MQTSEKIYFISVVVLRNLPICSSSFAHASAPQGGNLVIKSSPKIIYLWDSALQRTYWGGWKKIIWLWQRFVALMKFKEKAWGFLF